VIAQPGGEKLLVLGTHLSHLRHGSVSQIRRLRQFLRSVDPARAAVVAGDMNLPGPAVAACFPGWVRMTGPSTWPAWRPFLRPDHILFRPPAKAEGEVLAIRGSDHLPVRATLSIVGPTSRLT
jgi:endonuclease/exonuclease/phosphatase family metal-dependent hydrolase